MIIQDIIWHGIARMPHVAPVKDAITVHVVKCFCELVHVAAHALLAHIVAPSTDKLVDIHALCEEGSHERVSSHHAVDHSWLEIGRCKCVLCHMCCFAAAP